jgi:hypothetical protein
MREVIQFREAVPYMLMASMDELEKCHSMTIHEAGVVPCRPDFCRPTRSPSFVLHVEVGPRSLTGEREIESLCKA